MQFYGITPASFNALVPFEKQILKRNSFCELKVKFLRPYGVIFLDQLILNEKDANFKIHSTYCEANQYLKQIGFKHLHKNAKCMDNDFPETDIIKLNKYVKNDIQSDEKVVKWIKSNIIKYIKTDRRLTKKITENIYEIINNGLVHGNNKNGISMAGQFYPLMNYFEIAFYDRGIGIPELVKRERGKLTFTMDADYIEWAMQKGTSTNKISSANGLGLHFLSNFIKENRGHLQIISGNGYFCIDEFDNHTKETIKNFIKGTIVNIRVNYK